MSTRSDLLPAFRAAVHRWWATLMARTTQLAGVVSDRLERRPGGDGLGGVGPFNGADPREPGFLADPVGQSTWRTKSAVAYGSAQRYYSKARHYSRDNRATPPWLRDLRRLGPRWGIAAVLAGALTAGLALGLTLPSAQAADPANNTAPRSAVIAALAAQSDGAIASSGTTKQAGSVPKTTTPGGASPQHSEVSDEGRATAVADSAHPSSGTTTSTPPPPSSDLGKSWGDLTARYPTTYGKTVSPSAALLASIPQHLPLPANSGSGRRIIYDGASQHLWIVAADGVSIRDYPVTGRSDRPGAGTYHVYSMSLSSYNPIAKVSFGHMVRFAHGVTGAAIGFHSIPVWYNGKPLQTEASLGLALGRGGCVRQTVANATFLYNWVHLGDKVVVVR